MVKQTKTANFKKITIGVLFALLFTLSFFNSINTNQAVENQQEAPQLLQTNYDFTLVNESVHVYILKDGGVFINYTLEFLNHGDPIDYIDVGFPNSYYDLDSVEAKWDDGTGFETLTSIDRSSVIDIGVEVYIPYSDRISSGETGTLVIWGTNPHMVFPDTEHEGYAGILHPDRAHR